MTDYCTFNKYYIIFVFYCSVIIIIYSHSVAATALHAQRKKKEKGK